jgi:hypothetical protein
VVIRAATDPQSSISKIHQVSVCGGIVEPYANKIASFLSVTLMHVGTKVFYEWLWEAISSFGPRDSLSYRLHLLPQKGCSPFVPRLLIPIFPFHSTTQPTHLFLSKKGKTIVITLNLLYTLVMIFGCFFLQLARLLRHNTQNFS